MFYGKILYQAISLVYAVEHRRALHYRLGLPMDRPLLRIATSLTFMELHNERDCTVQGLFITVLTM